MSHRWIRATAVSIRSRTMAVKMQMTQIKRQRTMATRNCSRVAIVANAIAGNQRWDGMRTMNAATKNHHTNAHTVRTRPNNVAILACMCANIMPACLSWRVVASGSQIKREQTPHVNGYHWAKGIFPIDLSNNMILERTVFAIQISFTFLLRIQRQWIVQMNVHINFDSCISREQCECVLFHSHNPTRDLYSY